MGVLIDILITLFFSALVPVGDSDTAQNLQGCGVEQVIIEVNINLPKKKSGCFTA